MTYYGIAQTQTGKYGILLVTKEPGKRSSQQWTGEEFKSQKAAEARMDELNRPQFAPYFAHALVLDAVPVGLSDEQITRTYMASCSCDAWKIGGPVTSEAGLAAWEAHRASALSAKALAPATVALNA